MSITYKGTTMIYDLYNEEQGEAKISIPSSNRFYDDMVKLGRLALYGLLVVLLMIAPLI